MISLEEAAKNFAKAKYAFSSINDINNSLMKASKAFAQQANQKIIDRLKNETRSFK